MAQRTRSIFRAVMVLITTIILTDTTTKAQPWADLATVLHEIDTTWYLGKNNLRPGTPGANPIYHTAERLTLRDLASFVYNTHAYDSANFGGGSGANIANSSLRWNGNYPQHVNKHTVFWDSVNYMLFADTLGTYVFNMNDVNSSDVNNSMIYVRTIGGINSYKLKSKVWNSSDEFFSNSSGSYKFLKIGSDSLFFGQSATTNSFALSVAGTNVIRYDSQTSRLTIGNTGNGGVVINTNASAPSIQLNGEYFAPLHNGAANTFWRAQVSGTCLYSTITPTELTNMYKDSTTTSFTTSMTPYGNINSQINRITYNITAQSGNLLLNNPIGSWSNGELLITAIKDNGTPVNLTYDTKYRDGDVPFPASTNSGKWLYMQFMYNSTDDKFDLTGATNMN